MPSQSSKFIMRATASHLAGKLLDIFLVEVLGCLRKPVCTLFFLRSLFSQFVCSFVLFPGLDVSLELENCKAGAMSQLLSTFCFL